MAVDFSQFAPKTTALSTDYLVGYDQNASGGEKRFTLSTIANAVSSIITPALNSLVSQQTITLSAPTGLVAYHSLTSAPQGWIECNGAAITTSVPSYTNLRNFLINSGYIFGSVGSDPRVPDLRGKFIRANGNDGTYASASFGALQGHSVIAHTHGGSTGDDSPDHYHMQVVSRNVGTGATVDSLYSASNNNPAIPSGITGYWGTRGANTRHAHGFGTSSQSPAGGTETRPVNVALLACIKL